MLSHFGRNILTPSRTPEYFNDDISNFLFFAIEKNSYHAVAEFVYYGLNFLSIKNGNGELPLDHAFEKMMEKIVLTLIP